MKYAFLVNRAPTEIIFWWGTEVGPLGSVCPAKQEPADPSWVWPDWQKFNWQADEEGVAFQVISRPVPFLNWLYNLQ